MSATVPTEVPSNVAAAASDEDLVLRILAGDRPSFEIIMRRYNQRMFRIVRSIVVDDAEAEDVVQETYVRAFEHLRQFEGRAKFSTWLTRIAVHEASARRTRQRRMQTTSMQQLDSMSSNEGLNDDVSREISMRELHDVLARAVDELPDDLRTVFMLRVIEGMDTEETAACLDLTASNVKVRLHRGRVRLQSWIDGKLGQEVRRLYQFDGDRCDRLVNAVFARLSDI